MDEKNILGIEKLYRNIAIYKFNNGSDKNRTFY